MRWDSREKRQTRSFSLTRERLWSGHHLNDFFPNRTRNGRNSSCSASDERRDSAGTFMTTQVIVPARSGKAVKIREGSCVKLINTQGSQVVDTWAFNASDMKEFMSMEHTRVMLGRVNPKCGDDLFSNRRRVLLNIIEDTSPGVHDTLRAAC